MNESELHHLEAGEVARLLHSRKLSPVELTETMLAVASVDRRLGTYALVTPEVALQQARRAEDQIMKRQILGPLHGVPIGLKDCTSRRRIPTAAGMPIGRDFRPAYDGTVVTRLREAGAVLLGKLQLTEGAFADHHPDVRPPVIQARRPLVSSFIERIGVATAAGLCYGSIGSDTGGSIRFPSAADGVTGSSRPGAGCPASVRSNWPHRSHLGPICRSAADAGAMLAAIAGADPNDPTASHEPVPDYLAGLDGNLLDLRLGFDQRYAMEGTDRVSRKGVRDALEVFRGLGAVIRPVEFPAADGRSPTGARTRGRDHRRP